MDLPRARARLVAVLVQRRRRNRPAARRRRSWRPRWRALRSRSEAAGRRLAFAGSLVGHRRGRVLVRATCVFSWRDSHETKHRAGRAGRGRSVVGASAAYQAPAAGAEGRRSREAEGQPLLLKGGGGNTAVFVAANGVVVVDTKNPGWGQPILDKIKELTDKPVTTIINTHTHGDHVSGNVEFPATVDIVVQENTKTNMEKMAAPPGMHAADPPTSSSRTAAAACRSGRSRTR